MNAPVVWPKAARSIPNPEYNSLTSSPDLHALSQFRMHIIASAAEAEAAAEYFRVGRSRCTPLTHLCMIMELEVARFQFLRNRNSLATFI